MLYAIVCLVVVQIMCSETTMTLHVAYAPRSVDYFQYRKAGQLWNQGTSKGTNGLLTDRSNRQSILSKRLSLLLSRLLRKDTPRQRDDDLHDDPPYRHIADFHATWNDQKYFFPNRFKPDIDRYGQTRNLRNSFLTTRFQASPRNRRRPTDVAGAKMMNRISEYHLPRMGTFHEIKVSAEPRIDLLQIILLRNQRILAFLDTLQQTKKQSLQYYSQTKPQAEQDGTANQHPLVTDTVGHFLPLNNSEKNVSEGVEKHMTTQTNDLGRSQGHFASAKIGRNDQHRSSLSPLLSSPLVEAHNQGGFVEMDTLGTFGALDVDNPASPQGHRLVDHPDPAGGSWGAFDDWSRVGAEDGSHSTGHVADTGLWGDAPAAEESLGLAGTVSPDFVTKLQVENSVRTTRSPRLSSTERSGSSSQRFTRTWAPY